MLENHLAAHLRAALNLFKCLLRAQCPGFLLPPGLDTHPQGSLAAGGSGPGTGAGKLPVSGDMKKAA